MATAEHVPERIELAVLFSDIKGCSRFADVTEPEYTLDLLRSHYELATRTAATHGGFVFDTAGDTVGILFNGPRRLSAFEAASLRAAVQLRDDFRTIASYWSKRGPQVGLAIGVAAGFATVGVIGAGDHIGYRAIGRTVNVAGQLCGAALDGQILTNQQVADRAIGIALQPHDDVSSLRGIQRPTKVFRVA